ncbi:MAG: dihydrofolate reductase family protein [Acidimicrobiia bacterium]|nr:dihydrofolate reductase family protein [Acidimicrobiia bacterium]
MRASVFIATTADGFIARKNGDLDWLTGPDTGGETFGFNEFIASVDALVMGRTTFDFVQQAGEWPYGDTPVFVLTHRDLELPPEFPGAVEALEGLPNEVAAELAARGIHHVYVDGGETIQSFLRAGLVKRIIITQVPVLIGEGISLFGPLDSDLDLHLIRSRSYANHWLQVEYEVF